MGVGSDPDGGRFNRFPPIRWNETGRRHPKERLVTRVATRGIPNPPSSAPPGVTAVDGGYLRRPNSTARASCLTESNWRSSSCAFSS